MFHIYCLILRKNCIFNQAMYKLFSPIFIDVKIFHLSIDNVYIITMITRNILIKILICYLVKQYLDIIYN